jgi:hypothetical protein
MRKRFVAGIVAVGLALTGCSASYLDVNIRQAAQGCGLEEPESNSITFTQVDPESERIYDVACVLYALDVPESTVAKIENTRMIDGMQSDEWNGIRATWTYGPENGLTLILEPSR